MLIPFGKPFYGDLSSKECLLQSTPLGIVEISDPFGLGARMAKLAGHQNAIRPPLHDKPLCGEEIQEGGPWERVAFASEFGNIASSGLCSNA